MSIATVGSFSLPPPLSVPMESLKRFTVVEYHAMIDAGVFANDENFELLEGFVVRKMTKKPAHWIALELIRNALNALGIVGYFVHSQNPVTTDDSEPEPDITLVRGGPRDYCGGNPDPRQTPLVIEVAESSLSQDRNWKKRIYARASIPEYWIVNLNQRQVEVYSQPTGSIDRPDYQSRLVFAEDAEIAVLVDGREVGQLRVSDILP